MHRKRRWVVNPVATAEDLAEMLTKRTWTLCSGFYVEGNPQYLFLNDSTHEDGAGEFAAIGGGVDGPHIQVESITFSWCEPAQANELIRKVLNGDFDLEDFARPVDLFGRLDNPAQHKRCPLCA